MPDKAFNIRWPICNGRKHTAPQCCGVVFPLCWRCTGVGFGMGLAAALSWSISGWLSFGFCLLAMTITAADGYASYYCADGSTNFRRGATGLIGGVGLFMFVGLLESLT